MIEISRSYLLGPKPTRQLASEPLVLQVLFRRIGSLTYCFPYLWRMIFIRLPTEIANATFQKFQAAFEETSPTLQDLLSIHEQLLLFLSSFADIEAKGYDAR
ncbi:hypothetical protein Trydic_g13766 [Trypoxylus dichotomus]